MGNDGNALFIEGTAAKKIEHTDTIDFTGLRGRKIGPIETNVHTKRPLKKDSKHSFFDEKMIRSLRGCDCTFTKTEYVVAMLFCFAGSVLTLFIAQML